MSGFFTLGEIKERPGVYKRYVNGAETSGTTEKIAAAVVTGNWGPLNTAIHVQNGEDISSVLGSGTGAEVLAEIFADGPQEAVVVRVGSGGTKGNAVLSDTASPAAAVVNLTAKYPGDRAFAISIKAALDDETVKEATLYDGTAVLESRSFMASGTVTEIDAFVAAFKDSAYIDVAKSEDGNGILASVSQAAFTPGTNPSATVESYADGCAAIEAETWHYICTDSNNSAVHALLVAYVDRIFKDGAYGRAVIAETPTISLETRMSHAKNYNDYKVIYVLNGWTGTDGTNYNGYLAAARICGMLAACPSNQSMTHAVIKDAAGLSEALTNSQIRRALSSGCLVISMNKNQQPIIEKAINTLVDLADDQDAGWKKIRRTDTRLELSDRIEKAVDEMIGKVNNDSDGRSAVIAAAQRVIDAMVGEGKLISGTAYLDNTIQRTSDAAWFIVSIDDLDSLEAVYLTFKFRFSENS